MYSNYEVQWHCDLSYSGTIITDKDLSKLPDNDFFVVGKGNTLDVADNALTSTGDVKALFKALCDMFPDKTFNGIINWDGDDVDDRGRHVITNNKLKTYVTYSTLVLEEDFDKIDKIIKNYIGSDLKELIDEALED